MKAEAQRSVDINDAICEYVSGKFRLIPQVWNVRGGVGEIEYHSRVHSDISESKAPSTYVSCLQMTCN